MSAAAFPGESNSASPVFDNLITQMWLNRSNFASDVGFKGVNSSWFIGIDTRFKETPEKKSSGVKSHDLGGQLTSPFRDITDPSNC